MSSIAAAMPPNRGPSASSLDHRLTSPMRRSPAALSCVSLRQRGSDCSLCLATTPCGQPLNLSPGGMNACREYVGIGMIYKIGIGPSSSHTMGPCLAGKRFVGKLSDDGLLEKVGRVEISLYGSLALTGKGHATDKAIVLGLSGFEPSTINPDEADNKFSQVLQARTLTLNGVFSCPFDIQNDLVFHYEVELPYHPNGMTLQAYRARCGEGAGVDDDADEVIFSETYYSIGGGFIKTEREMIEDHNLGTNEEEPDHNEVIQQQELLPADCLNSTPSTSCSAVESSATTKSAAAKIPYPFQTCSELLILCKVHRLSIAELMIENECAVTGMTKNEVFAKLDEIASVMDSCVERGLRVEGRLPVSNIPRRAAQIKRRLHENMEKSLFDPLSVSDWISLYARAVGEENACGGRVVTAPTNGAAGTIPAVLTYYQRSIPTCSKQGVRDFLATAAAIGSLCKRNATISGAEGGCQAETGVACSMAAAGLTAVLGGNILQVENAAEIGLEHCLGLTCDPIMGLVQVPCIERNSVAALKAVMACRMALLGDGEHEVSLDSCIETMYRTGQDMQAKYRETSTGGLAVFAKKMCDV